MQDVSAYEAWARQALHEAERGGLRRKYPSLDENALRFDSNDYFSLRRHPEVTEAAREAVRVYGAGAGASRAAGGDCPLYAELEHALAERYGYPACLLVGSGYLANVGVIAALAGPGDLIVADKLCHASIWDGVRLSGAAWVRFRHNDPAHAERLLQEKGPGAAKRLILCETIYGMDGDAAPLAELAALARRYDASLLADHAHGVGFVRPAFPETELLTGTLSKAYGSYGGYLCCSTAMRDYLIGACRPALFSTALPPAAAAAAIAALRVLTREPERITRARAAALSFAEGTGAAPPDGAVVPVILGGNEQTLRAGAFLAAQGIRCGVIRPPSVPPGTARLRLAFAAEHRGRDVRLLIEMVKRFNSEKQ